MFHAEYSPHFFRFYFMNYFFCFIRFFFSVFFFFFFFVERNYICFVKWLRTEAWLHFCSIFATWQNEILKLNRINAKQRILSLFCNSNFLRTDSERNETRTRKMLLCLYYPENFVSWVNCSHEFFTTLLWWKWKFTLNFHRRFLFPSSLTLLQGWNNNNRKKGTEQKNRW